MITIYKITNRLNRKPYVGQTKQSIERRFIQHSKADSPLGNAMRQCGLDNFTIEVIEECATQEEANDRERFWIKVLNSKTPNGYNRSNGGEGGIHKQKTSTKEVLRMSVSANIVKLRERQGLNQKELAESLNMNRSVLNRIENGTRPVRDDELKIIADYFDVSADYLLGRETPKAPALSDEQTTILKEFDSLNSAGRNALMAVLNGLRAAYPARVAM